MKSARDAIMEWLHEHPQFNTNTFLAFARDVLGLSEVSARMWLRALQAEGLISPVKRGVYKVKGNE